MSATLTDRVLSLCSMFDGISGMADAGPLFVMFAEATDLSPGVLKTLTHSLVLCAVMSEGEGGDVEDVFSRWDLDPSSISEESMEEIVTLLTLWVAAPRDHVGAPLRAAGIMDPTSGGFAASA
jgi:hypothetical protein